MNTHKKVLLFVHCCIGIALFHVPGAMAQGTKVDVCHIPPGNPDNVHTITISENAVDTHLEHGDRIGTCGSEAQGAKVDVCHIPPGNPDNVHTITISENALDFHLDHGDSVGACDPVESDNPVQTGESEPTHDPEPTVEVRESGDPAESACACPKHGVWRVTNLDGWMECNVLGIKRTLRGAGKNDGAIWILNDDCSTIFGEAYEKEREDVVLERGRECLFFGVAPGVEQDVEVIFDGAYKIETEEFITGEYYMEMSSVGADCKGYRPFEIEYIEPLSEKDYVKLEKKMQEQLDKAREGQEEHRDEIEQYLEDTDGGLAFGGRNAEE